MIQCNNSSSQMHHSVYVDIAERCQQTERGCATKKYIVSE